MFEDKELKDDASLSESGLHDNCSIELRGKKIYTTIITISYVIRKNFSVLEPDERILVSELLEAIPDKYYEFAHLLGLSHTTIECFRMEYRDSPHRCLIAVLNHWVRNHAEDVSWTKVAETLEKLPRKDVARRIRSRYLQASDDDSQSHDCVDDPP